MRTSINASVVLVAASLIPVADLSAKCYVSGSVSLLRSNAEPQVLLSAWGSMASGHWGTCHLAGTDSIYINLSFDCPRTIWVTRDEDLVMDTVYVWDIHVKYANDGYYTLHTDGAMEWMGSSFQLDHTTSPTPFALSLAAMLDGPFEDSTMLMRDDLRMNGLVPLEEPYTTLGYTLTEGTGTSTTDSLLMIDSYPAMTVVDWVLVELRQVDDPSTVVCRTVGLISRTGWIRGADGAQLTVNVPPGDYLVGVRHRNHQGILTASPVQFRAFGRYVDLRSTYTACWGTDTRVEHQGLEGISPYYLCMRSGNASGLDDGSVSYTGTQNDRDAILVRLAGNVNSTITGYYAEDLDLDGTVSYTGANNDREVVLNSLPENDVNSVGLEQLP